MFTGIVEELGRVTSAEKRGAVTRIAVEVNKVCQDTDVGDSVCVNGVCLTVVGVKDGCLSFEAMAETLQRTTLKIWRCQDTVNLERAMKVGDRVGGHFVSGHVDGIGVIRSRRLIKGNLEFRIAFPAGIRRYLFPKGSVAVDGISLTIADIKGGVFTVYIIPHTAKVTTLGLKHAGDRVNIEADILAKRAASD